MKTEPTLNRYLPVLSESFLFSGIGVPGLSPLLAGCGEMQVFQKNQCIVSRGGAQKRMGILLSGAAVISKTDAEEHRVVLNELAPGGVFGVAALFQPSDEYVTDVHARQKCAVIFFSEQNLTDMFIKDARVAKNYICFLSQRIVFLNRKIDFFTLASTEERLASYLAERAASAADGCTVHLPGSAKELAQTLGVGRASLYRALETFIQNGLIAREGRAIRVLKPLEP